MTETPTRHLTLLKRALIANALFSSISAVVFIGAAGAVARLVGAAPADIASTGSGLILFVAMILIVLTRPDLLKRWVLGLAVAIAALDVLWVAITPINIAPYTAAGKGLFGGIALVVAAFAFLQIRGLIGIFRQLRTARSVAAIR